MVPWSTTLWTTSVVVPLLCLPGFGPAVNLETVTMIPLSVSAASLVRMQSREFSLWKSDSGCEGVVKEEGMDLHGHERAYIDSHQDKGKGGVKERASEA
jgi:hypothetical protein